MKTLNILQGSAEWLAARKNYFTASECPAMMGHGYTSRDDLLKLKKTGIAPEISPHLQALFDKGHATEALARPLAEKIVEEDFYPVTGVSDCGKYLASFDGLTMDETMGFEHKLLNQKVVDQIAREDLDPKYFWQLEHQMMVSGAESIVFVCSDGTEENFHPMVYTAVEGRREQLIAGWEQFEKDLADYTPVGAEPELVPEIIESLPSLVVEVSGEVRTSNIDIFQDAARAFIGQINMSPETDQDFINAENAVKECKRTEEKIAAAKAQMMGQMASVDEISRAVDAIAETIAQARIALGKTIKTQKEVRKAEIVSFGQADLAMHINEIKGGLPDGISLPHIEADFAGAIKGKRTLTSLQSAVNDEAARAKIEASKVSAAMLKNHNVLITLAGEHLFLFPDVQQLILKAPDDMDAVIQKRFADHKAAEREKAEREERIAEKAAVEAEEAAQRERTKAETDPDPEPAPEPAQESQPEPAVEQHTRQVEFIAKTQSHAIYRMPNKNGIELREHSAFGNDSISITAEEWIGLSALIDTAFSSDRGV